MTFSASDGVVAILVIPVVAGGTSIYAALLPDVDAIERTLVDEAVAGADATFPELGDGWTVESSRPGDDPRLTFERLVRR